MQAQMTLGAHLSSMQTQHSAQSSHSSCVLNAALLPLTLPAGERAAPASLEVEHGRGEGMEREKANRLPAWGARLPNAGARRAGKRPTRS
ncbi:hypothetical protein FA09DRAFT_331394 [Tilletiopsis washingtonensis]|uniref:Uncharacterized protein n=1 Tax=Tilletiopsis washingtonensis TaxID=58919 RepID=A0A316Z4M0_9BASI|nr:hypothetical protein FA09DRAFT_331394 [Tilletiopsis washingtonensis]PWN96539.1 hypothetical protein FA09DRAFT_331394 [Tilletiopsis washingtonensis]